MFRLRFDLRTPPFTEVTHARQYQEMIAMCKWGDERGFVGAVLSEHHGTDDGFMSSPILLAGAVLASTKAMTCSISALLVPYHDPIRLVEDMAAVDLMAPGRLSVVLGLGYRPEEFVMFGRDRRRRGRDLEDALDAMLAAWGGQPFTYQGRPARVNPVPVTPPQQMLIMGGSAAVSARRAARYKLMYMPPLNDPELKRIYEQEAAATGFATPFCLMGNAPGLVLVTRDPDKLWADIGQNLLYDAQAYTSWQFPDQRSSWNVKATSVDDLRKSSQYAVVTPDECVALAQRTGAVTIHPLAGGIDPEIGWESMRLVVDEVMPKLRP